MSELIGQLTLVSLGASVAGLLVAVFFYFRVKGLPEGNDTMNMIARFIREGAMAFLMREYRVLAVYAIAVFAFLFFAFSGEGDGPAGRRLLPLRRVPLAALGLRGHEGGGPTRTSAPARRRARAASRTRC